MAERNEGLFTYVGDDRGVEIFVEGKLRRVDGNPISTLSDSDDEIENTGSSQSGSRPPRSPVLFPAARSPPKSAPVKVSSGGTKSPTRTRSSSFLATNPGSRTTPWEDDPLNRSLPNLTLIRRARQGNSVWAGEGAFDKLVLVMVGLPARGKSFISHKLKNFLIWSGHRVRIFNVGEFRRKALEGNQSAEFFNEEKDNVEVREKLAEAVLKEMLDWLKRTGEVAIFDATNSNAERRSKIQEVCRKELPSTKLVFVESICTDAAVLEANILQKISVSPDYRDMDPAEARADLEKRLQFYESQYSTIEDDSLSYIKLFNLQSKVHCNQIYGRLAHSILPFLMGIHIGARPLWFTRAGDLTIDTVQTSPKKSKRTRRGSDPAVVSNTTLLNETGKQYALNVGKFVADKVNTLGYRGCNVMTSTLPRTIASANLVTRSSCYWTTTSYAVLNCLDKGECQGWSLGKVAKEKPAFYRELMSDPVYTRFPGGESYNDLMVKVRPCLVELEQSVQPVLVVSHLTVLQVLLCYYMRKSLDEVMSISIPRNCVVQITPKGATWDVEFIVLKGSEDTVISDSTAPV